MTAGTATAHCLRGCHRPSRECRAGRRCLRPAHGCVRDRVRRPRGESWHEGPRGYSKQPHASSQSKQQVKGHACMHAMNGTSAAMAAAPPCPPEPPEPPPPELLPASRRRAICDPCDGGGRTTGSTNGTSPPRAAAMPPSAPAQRLLVGRASGAPTLCLSNVLAVGATW